MRTCALTKSRKEKVESIKENKCICSDGAKQQEKVKSNWWLSLQLQYFHQQLVTTSGCIFSFQSSPCSSTTPSLFIRRWLALAPLSSAPLVAKACSACPAFTLLFSAAGIDAHSHPSLVHIFSFLLPIYTLIPAPSGSSPVTLGLINKSVSLFKSSQQGRCLGCC